MKERAPVVVIVGTRPEAIKLAPVIRRLARSGTLRPVVLCTSQHRHLVRPVLDHFDVAIDHDLKVMTKAQTLWDLSGRLVRGLGRFLEAHPARAVLVQGDTTSAFLGGLCGYYHQVPVGHVEAGLRTGNRWAPFPEEMNRKLLGSLAWWHFAPTTLARTRLAREGVPRSAIHVTGNTVVDASRWMARRTRKDFLRTLLGPSARTARLLLVTCHRRENFGQPLRSIASALARLARNHPDMLLLFPVHPNPEVRLVVWPLLSNVSNVRLCDPLDYPQFLACLQRAHLVLSDSGGVQEEATALGKPVLVLRNETERPEGIRSGALKLVGTDADRICRETERLLRDPKARRKMSRASDVFGDGRAAARICRVLEKELRG